VRLGDPKDNEYVVVRLGRDEVPFAPSELALSTRSKAAAAAVAASPPTPVAKAAAKPAPKPASKPTATPAAPPVVPKRAAAKPARAKRAAKSAGPRRATPPLTVTLRFRNDEWTVEAQRGARRLSKPGPLRPGAVSAFAEHVDDEGIQQALVETVESCRAVVEQRAAALRAELDEAEAALRDYESKPGRRTAR
jgi:hypothetical protein